jgi:hypothetical protein
VSGAEWPRRADYETSADWWEALTEDQRQEYIELYGNPPARAMRNWGMPQDPGFGNG